MARANPQSLPHDTAIHNRVSSPRGDAGASGGQLWAIGKREVQPSSLCANPHRVDGIRMIGPQARQAWLNTALKLCSTGLSFVLFLALARTTTPDDFARVALALVWVALGSAIVSMSMPAVLVRFVPAQLAQGQMSHVKGIVIFTLAGTAMLSTLVALSAFGFISLGLPGLSAEQVHYYQAASVLLVPSVLLLVLTGLLQGLNRVLAAELMANLLRPVLMLTMLAGLWWGHRSNLPASWVLRAYLASNGVVLVACAAYTWRALPLPVRGAAPVFTPRVWSSASLGFAGVMVAAAVNERVDLMMMGLTASKSEVAIYAVAARFLQPVVIAIGAATTVLIPSLLEQLASGSDARRVSLMLRGTARTMLSVAVLALFGLWLIAPWLLGLFGPHYHSALRPLLILVCGQVAASVFGPAVAVAAFTGRPHVAVLSLCLGITINGALNLGLVPRWGASGAAFATAAGTTVAALLAWWWLKHAARFDASVIARDPA
ncbi:MAG: lipopolysaccharide biosynthesis protein [Luteimonas sp.]